MTALGIRYLTCCAVSSDLTRQRHEFPPHPGRVFMAMAAAHFETQGDEAERKALEWIEQRGTAPHISSPEYWERRSSLSRVQLETFVPVNDKHGGVVGRSRQARSFPTVRLDHENVFVMWDDEASDDVRNALQKLCSKVTRIGHSSSLVQMWLVDPAQEIRPTLTPDRFVSERRMRVAEPGTLASLETAFAKGDRPRLTRWEGYREAREDSRLPVIEGPFNPRLLVFEKFDGRILGLESTVQLTSALRNAALKSLPQGKSPEWLSGHQPDGNPTSKPHVAFFPLPFVDAYYADGHVLGMAIAVPKTVALDDARENLGALLFNPETGEERTVHLWRNGAWDWKLRRESRDRPPLSLRTDTWTEESCVWASVTPVVLHHYPKKNRDADVERILTEAFVSAGLPAPKRLRVGAASIFEGAPDALSMPQFTEGGANLCRYQMHVTAVFDQCVRGPVLVGRGRFRGYGLFRPLRPKQERE
ncbi:MAG: type I-U CRISPR-associated protein Cas5/Cas6 [Acidobacteriaceae bacterium]|nr:type I-U CRISPR-associated protein Cas5/Cas6 [Acidobacteriaceae bacterium]